MIVFQGGRRMENISLMIKIGKQQAFFIDGKNEREKSSFFFRARKPEQLSSKKKSQNPHASSC
jgi:hypothetical protein